MLSKIKTHFLSSTVILSCALTVVLFIVTLSCFIGIQNSQEKQLWEDRMFIAHFGTLAVIAAMSVCRVWQYALKAEQKRKIGILLAAMMGIPSIFLLCVCWIWIIGMVSTYFRETPWGNPPFSFICSAFGVYGCAWIVLLTACATAAIVHKILSNYLSERTSRKKRFLQWGMQCASLLFGILTTIVFLQSLKGSKQLLSDLSEQWLIGWRRSTVLLYMCLAVVTGVDLLLGVRYLFNDWYKIAAKGAVLLTLGCLSSFVIWVEGVVMRRVYVSPGNLRFCLYIGLLQIVVTLLLHGITAVLGITRDG